MAKTLIMDAPDTQHQMQDAQPSTPDTDKGRVKFVTIAEKRVSNAIHDVRLVKFLAAKRYKYTRTDAEAIINALQEAIDEVVDAFNAPETVKVEETFRLPGSVAVEEDERETVAA